ncbi:type II toxin-antitoxin system VapC family toxin [archaeon]|nr:type II toxin-antitoxin system VapC family toxin [archaeon]
MRAVLDASVLVKLVLNEPGSEAVRALVNEAVVQGARLSTIELALAESLNAVWKQAVLLNEIPLHEAQRAAADLLAIYKHLYVVPCATVAERAFTIAVQEKIPIYDALYIAAAIVENAVLFTADGQLARLAQKYARVKHVHRWGEAVGSSLDRHHSGG